MILHAIHRKKVFLTLKKQAEDVERIDSVSVKKYMQSIVHFYFVLIQDSSHFFSRDFDSSNIVASFLSVRMNAFTDGKRLKFDVCEK